MDAQVALQLIETTNLIALPKQMCSECALHNLVMKAYCRRESFQCQCHDAGDMALLPLAEEALRKVHRCSILVNDLHPDNNVLVADGNKARVPFFVDFSHSTLSPSLAQCEGELCSLRAVFSQKSQQDMAEGIM